MVDHIKAVGRKLTFVKAIPALVTAIFFLWFLSNQLPQLEFLRSVPFENFFGGIWFAIIGSGFVLEGMVGLPDTKKVASKFGAFFVIGMGVAMLLLSSTVFIDGTNIIDGSLELSVLTTFLLGMGSILFFMMIYSELAHRESFINVLRHTLG